MNLRKLDLNLLPILEALLETHSTVKAAEKVGLSQSAVSAALSRLRETLSDPLFVREGQRLVPTEFALSLESPLRDLLQGVENLVVPQSAFDVRQSNQVFRISCSDFSSELLMPDLARICQEEAPLMRFQQISLPTSDIFSAFEDPAVDLMIAPKQKPPNWIADEHLLKSGFVFVARSDHPVLREIGLEPGETIPLEMIDRLSYILFSPEGSLHGLIDSRLNEMGIKRRVVMSQPQISSMLSTMSKSDLCAFVPEQVAHINAEAKGLALYGIPFEMRQTDMMIYQHRKHLSSPAHQWMTEKIKDILGSA